MVQAAGTERVGECHDAAGALDVDLLVVLLAGRHVVERREVDDVVHAT